MNFLKDFVLDIDIFAHGTLTRYRKGESYATVTGGIVSVIFVAFFIGMFGNLTIDTFQNNIVFSSVAVNYDDDPTEA